MSSDFLKALNIRSELSSVSSRRLPSNSTHKWRPVFRQVIDKRQKTHGNTAVASINFSSRAFAGNFNVL